MKLMLVIEIGRVFSERIKYWLRTEPILIILELNHRGMILFHLKKWFIIIGQTVLEKSLNKHEKNRYRSNWEPPSFLKLIITVIVLSNISSGKKEIVLIRGGIWAASRKKHCLTTIRIKIWTDLCHESRVKKFNLLFVYVSFFQKLDLEENYDSIRVRHNTSRWSLE